MPNRYRYKGRHRRPSPQGHAVAAMARPTLVIAAASAVSLGMIAPAAAHTGDYTVRPGDTLSSLAASYGTSWRTIYTDNRDTIGANPNVLRVGQLLSIGGSGSTPSASSGSSAYVVRAGDTLGEIAARHGTTWRQLHALNSAVIGPDPNVLRVGQRLAVSSGAAASSSAAAPPRASRVHRSADRDSAAPTPAPSQGPVSAAYSMWDPHVRPVVQEVAERYGVSTVLTRPGHSPTQGRAADFMVYTDQAKGDGVAQYVIDNAARFGVEYVIWQQRIYIVSSGSWQPMADRGSATANHMDHPHVAFLPAQ